MTALEEVKKEENVNGNGNADAAVAPSSTSSANKPSDPERDKALANSSITNSEENKLIKARIFVGNLPGDLRTDKGDIYDKFRKHGRIMGQSFLFFSFSWRASGEDGTWAFFDDSFPCTMFRNVRVNLRAPMIFGERSFFEFRTRRLNFFSMHLFSWLIDSSVEWWVDWLIGQ